MSAKEITFTTINIPSNLLTAFSGRATSGNFCYQLIKPILYDNIPLKDTIKIVECLNKFTVQQSIVYSYIEELISNSKYLEAAYLATYPDLKPSNLALLVTNLLNKLSEGSLNYHTFLPLYDKLKELKLIDYYYCIKLAVKQEDHELLEQLISMENIEDIVLDKKQQTYLLKASNPKIKEVLESYNLLVDTNSKEIKSKELILNNFDITTYDAEINNIPNKFPVTLSIISRCFAQGGNDDSDLLSHVLKQSITTDKQKETAITRAITALRNSYNIKGQENLYTILINLNPVYAFSQIIKEFATTTYPSKLYLIEFNLLGRISSFSNKIQKEILEAQIEVDGKLKYTIDIILNILKEYTRIFETSIRYYTNLDETQLDLLKIQLKTIYSNLEVGIAKEHLETILKTYNII